MNIIDIIQSIWIMTLLSLAYQDQWYSQRLYKRFKCQHYDKQWLADIIQQRHVSVDLDARIMVSASWIHVKLVWQSCVHNLAVSQASSGVSPMLQWVDKRIISNRQCSQTFGSNVVISSTMCGIGWKSDSQTTCNGDSGSANHNVHLSGGILFRFLFSWSPCRWSIGHRRRRRLDTNRHRFICIKSRMWVRWPSWVCSDYSILELGINQYWYGNSHILNRKFAVFELHLRCVSCIQKFEIKLREKK